MQNAALPENGKALALASLRNTLACPEVSGQMRRFLGPRGSASRQDVLVAKSMDAVSGVEDCETWVACRKAKRAKKGGEGGGDSGKQGKGKPSEGGRSRNGLNRRTGGRNRCCTCNSEYH